MLLRALASVKTFATRLLYLCESRGPRWLCLGGLPVIETTGDLQALYGIGAVLK